MRYASLFSHKETSRPRWTGRLSLLSWLGFSEQLSRIGILALAFLFGLGLAVTARAQGGGVLEGMVVNGTVDGAAVGAEIPIALYVYLGGSELEVLETTTDAEGRFRFEGLDIDPNLEYWPEAVYRDVPHAIPEPLQFEDDQTPLTVTLTVYEPTNDDSAISLSSVHSIAESFDQVLRITEIHLLSNSGDRTYVGGGDDPDQATTVFIPLPEGAVGLSFGNEVEGRFVEVEGGFWDTEPVTPGSETSLVFFSYHLIATGDTIPLERRFAYPVANLNMLVAQPGLALTSEQMQSRGIQLFQDRQYEFFVAENLRPDTPLAVEFIQIADASTGTAAAGMPPAGGQEVTGSTPSGNQNLLMWIGFGLAGLAVVGAILYSASAGQPTPAPRSSRSVTSDPKAQGLVAELADLEDALEGGGIDEATYEARRAEIYWKLKSL